MRCVVFTGAGGYEVIAVQERPDPEPQGGELSVRVRFAGLNPADSSQRQGRYPAPPGFPPDIPGLEVAGEVERVGPGVLSYAPGDRVFGLVGGGGHAERVVVHERCVARVPDGLDEPAAAAVPEAFVTAHDAIRTRGRLAPGEWLVVHGANGGVGTAAIQLGVAMGARVLGVTRSDAAAQLVAGLGARAVAADGFADAVLDATDGHGADVVLETVGGSHLAGDLKALARGGRIVVISVAGGATAELHLGALMGKRGELHGTVLRARTLEDKALAIRAFEREVLPALASARVRPLVDSVYPVEHARAAFERLDASGKHGKVLLAF
jgi:putative PIG3 family NAD(P)H quinone oxidoreductase